MGNKLVFNNWDEESFKNDYDNNFIDFENQMMKVAKTNPKTSHSLFACAILWFALKYIDKKEASSDELVNYMKLAMQGAYAHILTEMNLGKSQEVWIDQELVTLEKEASTHKTDVATLVDIYDIACICRCEKVKKIIINQIDPGPFFHNSNLSKSYYYSLYYLEKTDSKNNTNLVQKQFEEVRTKAAAVYENDNEWKKWYEKYLLPTIKLREVLMIGNEVDFNIQLQEVLNKDRELKDVSPKVMNPNNWIPWEINSLACRAHDKGWKITVEDSRLLKFLVEGKCNVTSLEP
ncbi:MAG: Imm49 family immunity protein [Kordia sp.]|uniref:Imm49 family immunity protein n=1 Tax=Kordia sp. TaxID=1965332 RepID=UPI00385D397B